MMIYKGSNADTINPDSYVTSQDVTENSLTNMTLQDVTTNIELVLSSSPTNTDSADTITSTQCLDITQGPIGPT